MLDSAAHAFASPIQTTWMINTVDKRHKTSHSSSEMKVCPGRPAFKNLHFTWCHACCGSISRQFLPSVTSNTLMRSSAAARTSCTGDRMAFSASIRVSFSPLSTWSRVETGPGPDAFIPAIFSPVLLRLTERWPGTRRKDAQRASARLGRDYKTMKCCHSWIIGAFEHNGSIHRNGGWTATPNCLFYFVATCCSDLCVCFMQINTRVAHK